MMQDNFSVDIGDLQHVKTTSPNIKSHNKIYYGKFL